MAPSRQGNLFGHDDEAEDDQPPPVYRADPDQVREDLHKILAEARAARKMPWEPTRVSLYRTIFPQMTNWLPQDEAAQLRFEFETELARLGGAWAFSRPNSFFFGALFFFFPAPPISLLFQKIRCSEKQRFGCKSLKRLAKPRPSGSD